MTDTFNVDTFTQTRDELQNLISGWCTKYARLIPSEILKKIKEEPIPEIVLSPNMTTTGGRFKRKSNQIILNDKATKEHLRSTLGHELAHWLDWVTYKQRGHGYTWKQCMGWLQLEPSRCHQHEELNKLRRRNSAARYMCSECQFVTVSRRRLSNRKWQHQDCGGHWNLCLKVTEED